MTRSILILAAMAGVLQAQTVITTDPFGSAGSEQHKHVVRSSTGALFALTIQDDGSGNRPLVLFGSLDQGQTWTPLSGIVNDASSGLSGTNLTNVSCMAIDSQDVLHICWGSFYYPSYYAQYYRQVSVAGGTTSAILSLTGVTGASNTSRTSAMNVAVDQNDTVWIVGHDTSSWVSRLLMSAQPGAANMTFTDLGPISMSFSAQSVRLAIDAANRVHCSYYRNTGSGEYWHRVYDPANGGWQPSTGIGNTQPTNDYYGALCADALGNVHALYGVDLGSTTTWDFQYRRWDATNGWGAPISLFTVATAQYTGVANYRISSIACDESTGKVTVVYRDLATGGALRMAEKDLTAPGFTNLPDLTPPGLGQHEYYVPAMRGALFPAFNNTGTDLDVTWRQVPAPGPYQLVFQRVGSTGPGAALSLSAPPVVGTTFGVNILSPNDPGAGYLCGFSLGATPGIAIGNGQVIPLNLDPLLSLSLTPNNGIIFGNSGFLSAVGTGTVTIALPPLPTLVGATIYGAFVVADAGSVSGIGTISPALPITFQ